MEVKSLVTKVASYEGREDLEYPSRRTAEAQVSHFDVLPPITTSERQTDTEESPSEITAQIQTHQYAVLPPVSSSEVEIESPSVAEAEIQAEAQAQSHLPAVDTPESQTETEALPEASGRESKQTLLQVGIF